MNSVVVRENQEVGKLCSTFRSLLTDDKNLAVFSKAILESSPKGSGSGGAGVRARTSELAQADFEGSRDHSPSSVSTVMAPTRRNYGGSVKRATTDSDERKDGSSKRRRIVTGSRGAKSLGRPSKASKAPAIRASDESGPTRKIDLDLGEYRYATGRELRSETKVGVDCRVAVNGKSSCSNVEVQQLEDAIPTSSNDQSRASEGKKSASRRRSERIRKTKSSSSVSVLNECLIGL